MKRTPLLTLLGGLVLGVVLFATNLKAGGDDAPPAPAAAADASPSVSPPPPAPTEAPVNAVWAGHVASGTLAISVQDGVAVAYLCDGRSVEAWLKGTAVGGELSMTGKDGGTLIGTFTRSRASGVLTVRKTKTERFTVQTVKAPSGLYRATGTVRGAQVEGGWIVLADGTQVGLVTVDGTARPAPPLDTATGVVTVDGAALTPTRPEDLS
jgi:serine/threonine-protein kinase